MNELSKLASQFALLFVVVYVVAAALGKKTEAMPGKTKPRNQAGGCNPWRGTFSRFAYMRDYKTSVAQEASANQLPAGTWVL